MDINKFTAKSQEAIRIAQDIAVGKNQQQVDTYHLLSALISQEDSIVFTVLKKIEINLDDFRKEIEEKIDRLPRIASPTEGQIYITQSVGMALEQAEKEMAKMGDEFVSTEHIFLAVLNSHELKDIFEKYDIGYDNVLKILSETRGSHKVDSPEPEGKFQALEKYTVNLTKLAREEKLDPVIGRD
ncbi:MAG: Clp protease N-terminal domain-containing protein, partial [Parcubacteria group bacterium]